MSKDQSLVVLRKRETKVERAERISTNIRRADVDVQTLRDAATTAGITILAMGYDQMQLVQKNRLRRPSIKVSK